MKKQKTVYQRVQLDGVWYVVIREEAFRAMLQEREPVGKKDALDVMAVSGPGLADRLLQRRQGAGLTQKDLARLAGVRVETLNRIEKGRTTPDFGTIRKLVNAINAHKKTD